MPSENAGKIIKKIKVNKKNIVITFEDKTKLDITHEAYTLAYLYEGKELDKKTIKELKEVSESSKHLTYCMNLFKKGHYSEYAIREKLYKREATKPQVDKVIQILKNASLIDDAMLAYDLYEWENEKLHGKNKIIKVLYDKGIFEKEINKLTFPRSKELQKAKANLPRLEKKYDKLSYENKKQHIYASLISLGFDNDIAMETLNKIKPSNDKEENKKLEIDFAKAYKRLRNKYEGRELKEKIIATLRNKGYRFGSILKMWEENSYDQNDFGI